MATDTSGTGGSSSPGGGGGGGVYLAQDANGNLYASGGTSGYYLPAGASITYPAGASTAITYSYPAGGTIAAAGTYTTTGNTIYWNPPLTADKATLSRAEISDLVDIMTTRVQPGEKVIICLEHDVSADQVQTLSKVLGDLQIEGVIIRAAKAAVPPLPMPFSAREQRVDYLARILDLWEQRPGLLLTELLSFYQGQQMGDNEFVTAVETWFEVGYK